jgi:hypothetical protein
MNQRREIVIALPVSAMKQALSKLERLFAGEIYGRRERECPSLTAMFSART